MTALEAGIVTNDIDGLTAFYTVGLGFEITRDLSFPQGRVRRLRRGDARLKLFHPVGTEVVPHRTAHWSEHRGFAYAALHVDDAEHTVARAVAAGARLLTPVTAHRPGARFALVADPESNVWEILEDHSDEAHVQ